MPSHHDLPERTDSLRVHVSARRRLTVALVAGVVAALGAVLSGWWKLAPLCGWDVTAVVLLVWLALDTLPRDYRDTAALAVVEDPGRTLTDTLLLGASLASLVAVGIVLVQASGEHGVAKMVLSGLGCLSVVISWSIVHTVFALRYARLYYTGTDGGINFNDDEPPAYSDFAYMAFTIGMTYQVSDTNIKTKEIRAHALRHALMSYIFGTVIVATTINLISSGLGK